MISLNKKIHRIARSIKPEQNFHEDLKQITLICVLFALYYINAHSMWIYYAEEQLISFHQHFYIFKNATNL